MRRARPVLFLFTDPRADPFPAIARLPRGAAVIFRHYDTPDRTALGRRVRAVCRRRGVLFLPAEAPGPRLRGDGLHRPAHRLRPGQRWPRGVRTAAAHDAAELTAAARARAHLAFLSPVFPTASHPGAPALGRVRFGLLLRRARLPVAALGGVTPARFAALKRLGAVAWGAISALRR